MEAIIVIVIIAVVVVAIGLIAFVSSESRSSRQEPIEPPRDTPASSGVDTLERAEGDTAVAPADADVTAVEEDLVDEAPAEVAVPPSFRDRLARARSTMSGALGSIRGRGAVDDETWDDLEEALIRADVGVGPTTELLDAVRVRVKEEKLSDPDALIGALKEEMTSRLLSPIDLRRAATAPTIWLFVGVNGVGKTTTIGKVARSLTDDGETVVLAAGDTFRAAAAEQLETWAERCGADIIRGAEGSDPSSVIFDAVAHGAATGADVVLADTAGRLHTKSNLMDELSKVRRVADKGEGEVTEVLLVLDATTGQNGLTQARQFTEAVDLTGVVLTKLDGSSKGGIVVAIQSDLGLPVKLVGLGEGAEDLVPFDAEQFVDALFAED